MINLEDIKESVKGSNVTLVHIPTGCHITVKASPIREVNRMAAMRLLESKLAQWMPVPKGFF